MSVAPASRQPLSAVQWLVCVMAAIGFAFDIYELLMLPLIIRPALLELTGAVPGSPEFQMWVGRLFFWPAFAGGIFGLLGGYLTDRLGRRRVLTWSILLYAFSAFAAGYSTSIEMLLFFRSTKFIGVCVEFVAAVAWLAELFTDQHQREKVLGYTQAFSSLGGLLVASVNDLTISAASSLPAIRIPQFLGFLGAVSDPHAAWRYTMLSGLVPALPLILIRPFLPESPAWQAKKAAGTLKRPSILELFAPKLRRTTIVTTLLFACSYGAAFGAIQHIPQMVPRLAEVKEQSKGQPPPKQKQIEQAAAAKYTKVQELGGLVGRCLLAILALYIVGRRALLWMFQLPGLLIMPLVFYGFATLENRVLFTTDLSWLAMGVLHVTTLHVGVFFAGLVTVAQFSFWGNYLPRVYPMYLRGTGESFAANIGGRILGTSFAWVTSKLVESGPIPGSDGPTKFAYAAAGVALFVFAAGSILCYFLPEPGQQDISD